MDRRRFLSALGLGAAAVAVTPQVAYFFGGWPTAPSGLSVVTESWSSGRQLLWPPDHFLPTIWSEEVVQAGYFEERWLRGAVASLHQGTIIRIPRYGNLGPS